MACSLFIVLVALTENVLHVHKPPQIYNVPAPLETDVFSTNGDLIPLINNDTTSVFMMPFPEQKHKYYQYKLRLRFENGTLLETRNWTTISQRFEESIMCGILLAKSVYNVTKSRYTLYFTK